MVIGVIGAIIFIKLEPIRSEISGWFEQRSQEKGSRRKRVSADRYRTDLIAKAQAMHMTRAIFSLEEILIPPRLLAPPLAPGSDKEEGIPESVAEEPMRVKCRKPECEAEYEVNKGYYYEYVKDEDDLLISQGSKIDKIILF